MNIRPSQLVDVTDPYEAFCIDDVVLTWGMFVNHELDKIKDKKPKALEGKRAALLRELLAEGDTVKRYANPVATR